MEKRKYQIKYLPMFDKQLAKIVYYITYKLKNKKAANRLIEKVEKAIIERSFNPEAYELYKSKKQRKTKWYRIYVDNYMVFYTVKEDNMIVAKIVYVKRDLKKLV